MITYISTYHQCNPWLLDVISLVISWAGLYHDISIITPGYLMLYPWLLDGLVYIMGYLS